MKDLFTLEDLPAGSLFEFNDTVALKTEYRTEGGAIEAHIIGSGEMFWGGTDKAEDQRKLIVKRVHYVSQSHLEKVKSDLETTGKQLYAVIDFMFEGKKL